jgi:uncharacterized glyoxalase superfamily protein PhnB
MRSVRMHRALRLEGRNGLVQHAELAFGDGVVMAGNVGPRNAGPLPASVRLGVYVFVEDVDAHFAAAQAAGVGIVSEPVELPFGDRMYLAVDLEGHEWYFAQHAEDVTLADLSRR